MNPEQEEIFNALIEEVVHINLHWKYLNEIFIDKPNERKQEILDKASPIFFDLSFHLFYDHILLRSSKLTDPAKQNGNDNLSIHQLINKLTPLPSEMETDITNHITQITQNISNIKPHRNKRLAHNDLKAGLSKLQLPLVNEIEILSVITGLEEILKIISRHYLGHDLSFEISVPIGSESSHLLNVLKSGVAL